MIEPTITAEDLTLYALNLLEGDEQTRITMLLRTSTEARTELASIRGDLALFALATEQQVPSATTRQRLMQQVARERRSVPVPAPLPVYSQENVANIPAAQPPTSQRVHSPLEQPLSNAQRTESPILQQAGTPVPSFSAHEEAETDRLIDAAQDRFVPSSRPGIALESGPYRNLDDRSARRVSAMERFFAWSGWAVAAAAAVAAAFAVRDDFNLRERLSAQTSDLRAATLAAGKADVLLQTLQSPASQTFVLTKANTAPEPSGRVMYLAERGSLVFQGNNLEALAPARTYELWLIPAAEGSKPVPAGLFKPDARGFASVLLPQLPKGLAAAKFGVTIEDDGGSQTPTLPILLAGQAS